jgi:hypothetical protein
MLERFAEICANHHKYLRNLPNEDCFVIEFAYLSDSLKTACQIKSGGRIMLLV